MIIVTYEYSTAGGIRVQHTYRCTTKEQAEHICRMVEKRKENGYKLIDISTKIEVEEN